MLTQIERNGPTGIIARVILTVFASYCFEGLLPLILWVEVPWITPVAGILQIPAAAWGLGLPPPALAPNGKLDLFVFMFFVQGALFSFVALVYQLCRRVS